MISPTGESAMIRALSAQPKKYKPTWNASTAINNKFLDVDLFDSLILLRDNGRDKDATKAPSTDATFLRFEMFTRGGRWGR
mmetsp:Transcript_24632/g.44537  ORF Transcript_24632/g.44537 Transcript_24632/m.44537 type:complete len:81 (-) Transcript_24632:409-651(-)